jgi:hypothetical protein
MFRLNYKERMVIKTLQLVYRCESHKGWKDQPRRPERQEKTDGDYKDAPAEISIAPGGPRGKDELNPG